MSLTNKKILMSLYSDETNAYSHQVRIVLAEKGVNVNIINCESGIIPDAVAESNPYSSFPTLIDRDLVLYHSPTIMEYLDERFPHPPLLPIYPVARAEARKMLFRIENDWYKLMNFISSSNDEQLKTIARNQLRDSITSLEPVFADKDFFMSDDFSMIDCTISPLFWRLPNLEIEIPKQAKSIHAYMKNIFSRASFEASLTEFEKELRVA
jgi:RNA polymerase-associated protein